MVAVVDEPVEVQIHIEQECVSIDVWVDQSPQAGALKECTPPMVAVSDSLPKPPQLKVIVIRKLVNPIYPAGCRTEEKTAV